MANTGNRTLTIDSTQPSISIVFPAAATYVDDIVQEDLVSIGLNWTVSDLNLQAC